MVAAATVAAVGEKEMVRVRKREREREPDRMREANFDQATQRDEKSQNCHVLAEFSERFSLDPDRRKKRDDVSS